MKPDAALIGPQRTVKLYSESSIYLYIPFVVKPRNAKHYLTLRLDNPLENFGLGQFRPLVDNRFDRFGNLPHRLVKF